MNKRNKISVGAITLLLCFTILNLNVSGQLSTNSSTMDGSAAGSSLASASSSELDVLFSYSDGNSSNVLILNGVSVPYLNSGWYNTDNVHTVFNQNYFCGNYYGTYYRNFFAFDLSNLASYGITTPITSAVLHIRQYQSEPASGTVTYELSAVSSSYSLINTDYEGAATAADIFNDLGDGVSYGSILVDKTAASSNFLDITLNSAAIAAINAKVGSTFILGGKNDGVVPVPVPYWAIALAFAAIASIVILRFRKKQLA